MEREPFFRTTTVGNIYAVVVGPVAIPRWVLITVPLAAFIVSGIWSAVAGNALGWLIVMACIVGGLLALALLLVVVAAVVFAVIDTIVVNSGGKD